MTDGIRILGAAEIRRKLQDPNFVGVPVNKLLPKIRAVGLRAAQSVLRGRGTGQAYHSLGASYSPMRPQRGMSAARLLVGKSAAQPGQVRIFSRMAIRNALSIEQGRPIGSEVPLGSLKWWKRVTNDPRPAFVIQKQIRAHGSPALQYLGYAGRYIQANMPRYMQELSAAFRRKWME